MVHETTLALRSEFNAVEAVKFLSNIVIDLRRDVLKENVDYGVIPGTGDKPTLLLPGIEKFTRALNAVPEYVDICIIRDYDKPLFHFEYECRLIDAETGLAIPGGRGRGLCNSMESSFAWRWVTEDKVPVRLDKSTLEIRNGTLSEPAFAVDKAETGGKYGKPAEHWQAFKDAIANNTARKTSRKNSAGKDMDIWEIGGTLYRIPNPDIFDQINAIMKRGKKRAWGDAIKGAANVSEFFTVDLEDFARYDDLETITLSTPPVQPQKPGEPPATKVASDQPPAQVDIDETGEPVIVTTTPPATNGNGSKSQTDAHDWTASEITSMNGFCNAWYNPQTGRPFTGEDALVGLRKAAWGEIHDGIEAAQGLVRGYAIRQCLPMIVSKCQYHNQGHGGYVALSNGQYTARLYGYDNKSGRETLSAFGAIWEAAMGKLTNGQGCELPGELLVHWRTSGDYNTATKVEVLMSENIPF